MYLLIQVSNDHGESGTADSLHVPEISPLMWRRANLRTMVQKIYKKTDKQKKEPK